MMDIELAHYRSHNIQLIRIKLRILICKTRSHSSIYRIIYIPNIWKLIRLICSPVQLAAGIELEFSTKQLEWPKHEFPNDLWKDYIRKKTYDSFLSLCLCHIIGTLHACVLLVTYNVLGCYLIERERCNPSDFYWGAYSLQNYVLFWGIYIQIDEKRCK